MQTSQMIDDYRERLIPSYSLEIVCKLAPVASLYPRVTAPPQNLDYMAEGA
jgi:hypothetical protein